MQCPLVDATFANGVRAESLDELLCGQEVCEFDCAIALILDDSAGLPRRAGSEALHRAPRSRQGRRRRRRPRRSASVRVSTGFFFAAMMPLNEG